MIRGTIHREDRHHKPLGTLTTKKQKYIKQKSEEIKGKRNNIYNHNETYKYLFENILSSVKKKKKSILDYV